MYSDYNKKMISPSPEYGPAAAVVSPQEYTIPLKNETFEIDTIGRDHFLKS
jgi:hypothetical protein